MNDRSTIPFTIFFPVGTALLVIGINTTPVLIAFGGFFLLVAILSLTKLREGKKRSSGDDRDSTP